MRQRKVLLNAVTMRPIMLAYDLNTITVEEMEQLVYGQGFAYAADADRCVACLTTPRADEDVQIH